MLFYFKKYHVFIQLLHQSQKLIFALKQSQTNVVKPDRPVEDSAENDDNGNYIYCCTPSQNLYVQLLPGILRGKGGSLPP